MLKGPRGQKCVAGTVVAGAMVAKIGTGEIQDVK
jgi:hypothetical protein